MDLAKYQELTGISVPTSQVTLVTAQIKRTGRMLETMLGFTLDPSKTQENLYNELGKTLLPCSCLRVDNEELAPPDDVVGAYRLFDYNDLDQFFWVDPFTTIHSVKLVRIKQGTGPEGVTIKTFSDNEIRIQQNRGEFKKYIEHCMECMCYCVCTDCVQLAVDADWLWTEDDPIPDDLLDVWSDMTTFYSDQKNNIEQEKIDTHLYKKFERLVPELQPYNLNILKKYSGPNGSVSVMPTTGARGRR